jgi:hypothetical protein
VHDALGDLDRVKRLVKLLGLVNSTEAFNELMTENLHFYRQLGFEEEERRIEDGYHRVFLRKTLV